MSVTSLLRAFVLALALLPAAAFTAAGDDGRSSEEAGRSPSPPPVPLTQLRPVATPPPLVAGATPSTEPAGRAPRAKRELVLFVGGYGSTTTDGAFETLRRRLEAEGFEVRRFGDDAAHPYDTYGTLDRNADALIAQIREAAASYSGVHLVSHSMGGAVVDRAFARGLSASDGVITDVAIAAPHNGSTAAKVPDAVFGVIGPVRDIVRAIALRVNNDPDTPAMRDLATARPVPPPRGIVRLDLTLANDGLVPTRDSLDPGVERRVYLPASWRELVEGHGGSLENGEIREVIAETARSHAVPADRRAPLTLILTPFVADVSDRTLLFLLALAAIAALALAAMRFFPASRYAVDAVATRCRRYLRSRGR